MMRKRPEAPELEATSQKAAFFDTLSEGGLSGIIVYQDELVVFCNPKAQEILDRPMDRILGVSIREIVDGSMHEEMIPALEQRTADELGAKQYLIDIVTGSGSRRRVQFSISTTTFHRRPAVIAVLMDVTEMLRPRAEAERSDGLFRTIFDSSRDAVLIFDGGGERLIDVNRQMRHVFQTGAMSLGDIEHFLHLGKDWERRKAMLEAAGRGEPRTYETWINFNQGGGFWAEVWIDRFFIGPEPQLLVIIRDISENHRVRDALRSENEFFSMVLDSGISIVVGADADGHIVIFNHSAEVHTGLKREQAMGRDWIDVLVAESARERAHQALNQRTGGGEFTLPMATVSGTRSIFWSVTPVYRHGMPIHIAIGVDITDLESQRLMNEGLNNSLRLFNRILRHDITNDLMVAMGSLQLYDRKKEDRLLTQCMGALEKCIDLINDMGDLEATLTTREMKEMDLGRLARKASAKYEGDNVVVHVRGEGKVMADDALSSVMDNLVRNALMHGKAEHISLEITSDGAWTHLAVRDDGKGVPASIKASIFEEGFKFGETGNTGLGLYIVRRSMERYGGAVRIEDNHPKGSSFILTFPAQPAAPGR